MRNTASRWLPTGFRAAAYQTIVWFGTLLVFGPVGASEPHPFTATSTCIGGTPALATMPGSRDYFR